MSASTATRPAERRARRGAVLVVAAVLAGTSACSSSSDKGAPNCNDTSAAGTRLAQGCVHDGKTYAAKVEKCTDGTTLYTIPFTPEDGGASAYTNGRLRARTATTQELVLCLTGQPLSASPSP